MRNMFRKVFSFFHSPLVPEIVPLLIIGALVVFAASNLFGRLNLQAQSPTPTVTDKEIVRVLDPTNGVACYIFRDSGAISCVKFTK